MKQAFLAIRENTEYLYIADQPAGCKGCKYRVVRLVQAVPSYQTQVCVEALEGPDAGKWFTCSPHNFSTRYAAIAPDPAAEKAAGYVSEGSGV